VAFLLYSSGLTRTFDIGPDPRKLYERVGGMADREASRQVLVELISAYESNTPVIPPKVTG
jgi:hypothetical protein